MKVISKASWAPIGSADLPADFHYRSRIKSYPRIQRSSYLISDVVPFRTVRRSNVLLRNVRLC